MHQNRLIPAAAWCRPQIMAALVYWLAASLPAPVWAEPRGAKNDDSAAAELEQLPDASQKPSALAAPRNAEAAPIERLVAALEGDSHYKVRLQAAILLGRTGQKRAYNPLKRALAEDAHYTVRAAAALGLANLDAPRAATAIVRAAGTDAEEFVRQKAMQALDKLEPRAASPYVVASYNAFETGVRQAVIRYLAKHPDAEGHEVLVRALGDSPRVFAAARDAMLNLGEQTRQQLLKKALEHRETAVRRGAVEVLRAADTPAATAMILDVYQRDIEVDRVRSAARTALAARREHLPMERIVTRAREATDKHERANAIKLLGVVGGPEAENVLLEALADDDIYVRGNAVMAIGELGTPSAVPSLERLADDPANQRIVHLVRHTLKQLRRQQESETD